MNLINQRKRIGALIRQTRKGAGLSQKSLADKCGMDKARVSEVERGDHNFSIDTLHRLTEVLECSIEITTKTKQDG